MKKRIKIMCKEYLFIAIELVILIAIIIGARKFFKGNLQNIITAIAATLTILAILISIHLTIINRKQLYMPYFLIANNVFIITMLGAGPDNINGSYSLLLKFRLIGLCLAFILCTVNYKIYEEIYMDIFKV